MNNNITIFCDELNNTTICNIEYDGRTFTGTAKCHPDDVTFFSERTGGFIAEVRANIKLLKYKRNYEIIPAYKALKRLHANMSSSTHYDKHSYEARMLYKELKKYENEIDMINADIQSEKQYLKDYINNKDLMYKKYLGQN